MSNYTKSTNFATKDNLTPGDPLKVVRGTEIDTEFNNISTAIATKTDNSAAAITGGAIDGATVGATTPATGAFTTLAASGTTTLAGALVGAATQSAFNTVSTTLNLGGAATALNLGAATGTATVNNTTLAAKAITASTTLAVTGTSTLTGAVTATAGVSGPITSSSVSITGGSITGITDLAVADGGTGASTAADGLNNLLPSQTGNASKYLQTDGTNASWDAVSLSTADITGTLGAANGGTGVSNNAAMTVTGSGNFAYTRTLTGTTNVTFPTTGTLATLAGTETLTNKTINLTSNTLVATSAQILAAVTDETGTGALVFATSPTLVTPTLGVATGTSFQGIIGNVTPAAGSFTTLGASSTATLNTLSSSGATLTGGTINGMTVGATTASTGAFTTLTTSSTVTHNGGTANGVTYLNGSKVLTSGSGLQFDGTNLGVGGGAFSRFSTATSLIGNNGYANAFRMYDDSSASTSQSSNSYGFGFINNNALSYTAGSSGSHIWFNANTEGMRLTSTGLGIGTSSPAEKLTVSGRINFSSYSTDADIFGFYAVSGVGTVISAASTNSIVFRNNASEKMRLDSAGNLGLGVTPSAWDTVIGSQVGRASIYGYAGNEGGFQSNCYFGTGNWRHIANGTAEQIRFESGQVKFRLGASGTAGNTVSFTQAMTLDASGNLIVGGTSPFASDTGRGNISINGASTSILGLGVNNVMVGYLFHDGTNMNLFNDKNGYLRFATNGSERARIDSSGNLLVGKTALSDVTTGVQIYGGAEGSMALGTAGTGGANNIEFFRGTAGSLTSVGKIQTTGTATSYITSSDYRLKENIAPMTGALATVAQLKPCTYTWKADGSSGQGFIAHELQTVVPDAVVGAKDAIDADGNIKPQGIDTSFLVATLTAAIQEQQALIESLKARLDAANL